MTPLRRTALSLVSVIALLASATPAFAYDASMPYRSYPAFTCYRWNYLSECTDWSYFDSGRVQYFTNNGVPPPAYGGTYAVPYVPTNPYVNLLYGNNPYLGYAGTQYVAPVRYQCSNPNTDCTGTVSIRGSSSPNPVGRGTSLTYSLYLRNDDSQTRNVNIRAFLDKNTTFQSANFNGYDGGNVIRWDSMKIAARTSRTILLRVYVGNAAGSTLEMHLQAERSTDLVVTNLDIADSYYDNAIRYSTDGNVYARYGHPRTYQPVNQYQSQYYYDNDGNLHYRSQGPTYYCDPHQYVCN